MRMWGEKESKSILEEVFARVRASNGLAESQDQQKTELGTAECIPAEVKVGEVVTWEVSRIDTEQTMREFLL